MRRVRKRALSIPASAVRAPLQRCVESGGEKGVWRCKERSLLSQKDAALDEGVEEVADGVVVFGAGVEEGFDFGAVGEADGGAGGVDGELMEEVAGELARVGGDEDFEVVDVVKGAAVEEFAGGVHGGGDGVTVTVSGAVDAGDSLAFFKAAIVGAPAAEDVEVFEGEADGIEPRVAGGAGFGFGVEGEEIADGFGTANVGLHSGHAGRRWRWWLADEAFHDPGAADDG